MSACLLFFITFSQLGIVIGSLPDLTECHTFVGIIDDRTRFGDRILDTWSLMTLFSLSNSSASCDVFWQPTHFPDGQLFSTGHCQVRRLKHLWTRGSVFNISEYRYESRKICIVDFHDIFLFAAGNADPVSLFNDANAKRLFPRHISEEILINQYKSIARVTQPAPAIRKQMENHFNTVAIVPVVGIHIRRTDKIRSDPMSFTDKQFFTSATESNSILDRIIDFVAKITMGVYRMKHFFLAVDHEPFFNLFATRIEAIGGIISNNNRHNVTVLGDFFSLSACKFIIQGVRYSSFSVAAAAAGDAILINFSPIFNNNLHRWLSVVRSNIIEADFNVNEPRRQCYPNYNFINASIARLLKELYSKNLTKELTRVLNKDEEAMAAVLKPWEATHSRFEAVGPLVPRCRTDLEKFGSGDEEKRACDLTGFASGHDHCVVISIGSKNIWSFEESVVKNTKCEIHVFDCTLESSGGIQVPKGIKHRVTGYDICIGSRDEIVSNRQFLTYGSILNKANLKQAPTFLKMDIEGYEWEVLPSIIENNTHLPLQIAFEFHYGQDPALPLPWGHAWKTSGEIITFIDYLYRAGGYFVIDRHDNEACGYATELLIAKVCV